MIIKNIADVPPAVVEVEGAQKATVRVLFGPKDNAPTFAMRLFELQPGGCTPHHQHPFEHQVIVIKGNLILIDAHGETPITVGDVAMIMPDDLHQFQNRSKEPAQMMCMVPVQYQP